MPRTLRLAGACLAALTTGPVAAALPGAASAATQCPVAGPHDAMQIDADCVDPIFNAGNFVIDRVTHETTPLPHTRVEAHFDKTATTDRFNVTFYMPARDAWQGRFFQHVYPLHQDERKDDIDFALRSGGYLVNVEGVPCGCGGYRVDAAAAKLARAYAEKLYGPRKHIYGYVWGGSGGSFQAIGAVENTTGVWDGAVPFVIANEGALVNFQAIAALAGLVLKDRLADIADAVKPGGSGHPYDGLTFEQRSVLTEALRMGVPLRGFEDERMFNPVMLKFVSGGITAHDPAYYEDFWTRPGYEGANPPPFLEQALVDRQATITRVLRDGKGKVVGIGIDPQIPADAQGVEGTILGADGKPRGELGFAPGAGGKLGVAPTENTGVLGGQATLALSPFGNPAALDALREGTKLHLANRRMLALMFYHRHSIPKSPYFHTYDQYRSPFGTPIYPQRSYSASVDGMVNTSGGGTMTGKIRERIIIVGNLLDVNAYPFGADYYAGKVRRALGEQAFRDDVRIWYQDNADHFDDPVIKPHNAARLVTYVPVLYQALRDMAAWVEKGVPPPDSTSYRIVDGQVEVPATAAGRRGIQPVVVLTGAGGHRVEAGVNQPVALKGTVAVPPGTGKVVSTSWYLGTGPVTYTPAAPLAVPQAQVQVERTVSFAKPGTYFVTLRATAQRDGKLGDPTGVENLDRVRVVVR